MDDSVLALKSLERSCARGLAQKFHADQALTMLERKITHGRKVGSVLVLSWRASSVALFLHPEEGSNTHGE